MKADAAQDDVEYAIARSHSLGWATHVSQDQGRVLIGLLGSVQGSHINSLRGLRGVERVIPASRPFRLASREFKPTSTVVTLQGYQIGGDQLVVIAGPCAVESRSQLLEAAWAVKEAGGHMLRGGAFKPRTSPYSFQGLGEQGLEILAEAREQTGLLVVTEVMAPEQVPLVSRYADVLQVGARNMQNYNLLHAVGASGMPVLLKRGMMSTIEELLMSAEYILSHSNQRVILAERGIRTFETYTRNSFDINAIPLLKELTHLPVIADPSHATGQASLVTPVSRAAIAAGADGLILEVHPEPARALSDGYQSLTPAAFRVLMDEVAKVGAAVGRLPYPRQQAARPAQAALDLRPASDDARDDAIFAPLREMLVAQDDRPAHLDEISLRALTPFQRALLVADGTVTRLIESYKLEPVEVVALGQSEERIVAPHRWLAAESGTVTLAQRALLRGKHSGRVYAHSSSLIVPARLPPRLLEQLGPSGAITEPALVSTMLETRREVLWYGLERAGGDDGDAQQPSDPIMLSRTYRVIAGGCPVMLVSEQFPATHDPQPRRD